MTRTTPRGKAKPASTNSDSTLAQLKRHRVLVAATLLLFAIIYAAVPQLGILNKGWGALHSGDWRLFGLGIICLLVSYLAASCIYMLLAPVRLWLSITYVVQMASSFAGRILPAGLGSISVNYLYLRRQGLSRPTSGTVVAINNLLGTAGHLTLLLLLVLVLPGHLPNLQLGTGVTIWRIAVLGALLAVAVLVVFRRRVGSFALDIKRQLLTYRDKPDRLVLALICSMGLTFCNVLILWLCARAVGSPIGILPALIAMSTGVIAQTATPTPGGLGGVEAGLIAGLAIDHVSLAGAVAAALAFRLITFWLPLVIGGAALIVATRKHYV